MKQKTNLALDSHTIDFFINRIKAIEDSGNFFVIHFFKTELEALQKEGADVAPQLREINDYLETFIKRKLQALETDDKAASAPATED